MSVLPPSRQDLHRKRRKGTTSEYQILHFMSSSLLHSFTISRLAGECDESPPKELQSEDRLMLFKAREQLGYYYYYIIIIILIIIILLVRTPPKGRNFLPFQPPSVQAPPPEPRPHMPSFDINKVHVDHVFSNLLGISLATPTRLLLWWARVRERC